MSHRKTKGFTMIEVLVAVIVIGTAVLGIMTLQTMGLNESQGAYNKSQATILANDIAERMRTNPQGVIDGDYNSITSAAVPTEPACISGGTACSTSARAQADARDWLENFTDVSGIGRDGANWIGVIPGATGTVTGDGSSFVITIIWQMSDFDESNPGERALVDRTYTMNLNL